MALLARIGGPTDVAADPDKARKLLLGISHRLLPDDKVTAILACTTASVGVPLVGLERDALMAIADDAYRAHRAFTTAKTQVDKLAAATPAAALAPVVGHTTAAAVFAEVGDARSYSCTRAFLKAMGLNLKEKSSGTVQGQLKITKRGPSRVRQYLWLAIFRWIQTDPFIGLFGADRFGAMPATEHHARPRRSKRRPSPPYRRSDKERRPLPDAQAQGILGSCVRTADSSSTDASSS
jgi:hypothetical protein